MTKNINLTDPIQATHYIDNIVPVFLYKTEDNEYFQWSQLRKKWVKTLGVNEKLLLPLDNTTTSYDRLHKYLVTLTDGTVIEQEIAIVLPESDTVVKVA